MKKKNNLNIKQILKNSWLKWNSKCSPSTPKHLLQCFRKARAKNHETLTKEHSGTVNQGLINLSLNVWPKVVIQRASVRAIRWHLAFLMNECWIALELLSGNAMGTIFLHVEVPSISSWPAHVKNSLFRYNIAVLFPIHWFHLNRICKHTVISRAANTFRKG